MLTCNTLIYAVGQATNSNIGAWRNTNNGAKHQQQQSWAETVHLKA